MKKIELQNKDMELEHRSRVAVLEAELNKAKTNERNMNDPTAVTPKNKTEDNVILQRPLMESSFGEFAANYTPFVSQRIQTGNATSSNRVGFVPTIPKAHPQEKND